MIRSEITNQIKAHGIIGIIRSAEGGPDVLRIIAALLEGGLPCIEISMNTPGAIECIAAAAEEFQNTNLLLGVGTVLDADTCRNAIQAGAQYVVSPITSAEVIHAAHRLEKPILPGALTPNEIVHAWELGGDLIKVFPNTLGGLEYIKALRAPLPDIPLVPTGGVTPENMKAYFGAGIAATGIGNGLVRKDLVAKRDFTALTENARRFATALQQARM